MNYRGRLQDRAKIHKYDFKKDLHYCRMGPKPVDRRVHESERTRSNIFKYIPGTQMKPENQWWTDFLGCGPQSWKPTFFSSKVVAMWSNLGAAYSMANFSLCSSRCLWVTWLPTVLPKAQFHEKANIIIIQWRNTHRACNQDLYSLLA